MSHVHVVCNVPKLRMSVANNGRLGTSNQKHQEKCNEIPRAMEKCSYVHNFDNSGQFLALLTPDGRLKVWNCINGTLKLEYTPSSHLETTCTCLKWSHSSRVLVSMYQQGLLRRLVLNHLFFDKLVVFLWFCMVHLLSNCVFGFTFASFTGQLC